MQSLHVFSMSKLFTKYGNLVKRSPYVFCVLDVNKLRKSAFSLCINVSIPLLVIVEWNWDGLDNMISKIL